MRVALLAATTLALLVGVASAAPQPVGSDFRISNTRGDGDGSAVGARIAYNPAANEYLVVWLGNGLANDEDLEIFGQRLDANGTEIGGDFRISNVTDVAADRDAFTPAVNFNPATNQYLVVWSGDGLATDNEFEIFGQRLDANGTEIGGDFRISNVTDVAADRDAARPAVTFNPATNQYLVAWAGDGLATDQEVEIFGQVLGTNGTEIGEDFRISNVTDVAADREAARPALTYNPTANQYLVAWEGDGLATDNESEIFGQRLDANGTELEADFRISNAGPENDADRDAFNPVLAYNPAANQYLVVWEDDGLATDNEFEIFGQRLNATGAEVGRDFRVSNATDVAANREAFSPALTYNPTANQYLVAWDGDGLATDNEFEIFGRRLAEPGLPPSPPGPPSPQAGKCAGVKATKTGTAGADVIKGTPKRDVIAALGGKDTVRSLGGNDLVCGGAGNDVLRGGKGRDVLRGGKGRDVLKGGPGRDRLAGGPGEDKER